LVYDNDLYLYGGVFNAKSQKSVHKFSTASLSWSMDYFQLQQERSTFVALPVEDTFCKEGN